MKYPIKLLFQEYDPAKGEGIKWENNPNVKDWSQYLVEIPSVNMKVESDRPGEAGLVTYDNCEIILYYDKNNEVFNTFAKNDKRKRYLIRIEINKDYYKKNALVGNDYIGIYEGLIDFTTLYTQEGAKTIKFEIIDKLAALNTLIGVSCRKKIGDLRQLLKVPEDRSIVVYKDKIEIRIESDSEAIDFGMVITIPDESGEITNIICKNRYDDFRSKDVTKDFGNVTDSSNGIKIFVVEYISNKVLINSNESFYCLSSYQIPEVFSKEIYDIDCNEYDNGRKPIKIKIKELIESIINKAWPGTKVVYKNIDSNKFKLPINYFSEFMGYEPLGTDPISAIKKIINSLNAYMFFNSKGELEIRSKNNLYSNMSTNTIVKCLKDSFILDGEDNYFWDKLVDLVEIKASSWYKNEKDENIEVSKMFAKFPGTKPRNPLEKEVILFTESTETEKIENELNSFAEKIAQEYGNFYGLRRNCIKKTFAIDQNLLDLQLMDLVTLTSEYKAEIYFLVNIQFDFTSETIKLELVNINGEEYDEYANLPQNEYKIEQYRNAQQLRKLELNLNNLIYQNKPFDANTLKDVYCVEVDNIVLKNKDNIVIVPNKENYSGNSSIRLEFNQIINNKNDPENKWRTVLNDKGAYQVSLIEDEFKDITNYLIFLGVSTNIINENRKFPNYGQTFYFEDLHNPDDDEKGTQWYLVANIPVDNSNKYNKVVSYLFDNLNDYLGNYISFFVGGIIPKKKKFSRKMWGIDEPIPMYYEVAQSIATVSNSQSSFLIDNINPTTVKPIPYYSIYPYSGGKYGNGYWGKKFIQLVGTGVPENFNFSNPEANKYWGAGFAANQIYNPITKKEEIVREVVADVVRANTIITKTFSIQTIKAVNGSLIVSTSGKIGGKGKIKKESEYRATVEQ